MTAQTCCGWCNRWALWKLSWVVPGGRVMDPCWEGWPPSPIASFPVSLWSLSGYDCLLVFALKESRFFYRTPKCLYFLQWNSQVLPKIWLGWPSGNQSQFRVAGPCQANPGATAGYPCLSLDFKSSKRKNWKMCDWFNSNSKCCDVSHQLQLWSQLFHASNEWWKGSCVLIILWKILYWLAGKVLKLTFTNLLCNSVGVFFFYLFTSVPAVDVFIVTLYVYQIPNQ